VVDSFADLLERVRSGDEDAADEIVQRFTVRLVALARKRIEPLIRAKDDPEDVLQSVYRSFFARARDGQFELDSWTDLWALLARITVRKCGHRVAYSFAARRDARRNQEPFSGNEASPAELQAIAREPTPIESAMLAETLEDLMVALDDGRRRQILTLRLQGHSFAEISRQVGRSEQTVHRVLEQARNWLMRRDGVEE
jgi:RNA polymerase sigma-70 factor (ECF subfamily)